MVQNIAEKEQLIDRLIGENMELLEALKDVELRTVQAKIANEIGKKSKRMQIDFLLGELERIGNVSRAAISKAEGGA